MLRYGGENLLMDWRGKVVLGEMLKGEGLGEYENDLPASVYEFKPVARS